METRGSTIYTYFIFITFTIVCIHGCGGEDGISYDLKSDLLSIEQVHTVEAIVFQIADCDNATTYSIAIEPDDKKRELCRGSFGCMASDGSIYVFASEPRQVTVSLIHELIHLTGLAAGKPWMTGHTVPQFVDSSDPDWPNSWEHCARAIAVNQLFPEDHDIYYDYNLEECEVKYGF